MKTFTRVAFLLIAGTSLQAAEIQHCAQNRKPLRPQPYLRLPPGCVQANGWLKTQLELQRDGLTGNAETLYDDIGQSDWVSDAKKGGQYAWERGPYYAKGLIALAYVLGDAGLTTQAQRWVDHALQSQRPDGDFGPKTRNWWANMIVLHYMRDYYEASGDERALTFLERYFRFQLSSLPAHSLIADSKWAQARGGDNLEIVLWYYNLAGGDWLLKLAGLLVEQTAQWERYYADGTICGIAYPDHIVNVMQGLKTPPLMWLVTGSEAHRVGYWNATRPDGWLMRKYGRADCMFNGTEPLTDRSSTGGTELCAVVERILSCTVALQTLGDAAVGDQLETVAYNALPADLAPDIKGLRYYTLLNQPKCTNEKLGFRDNGDKVGSICPGPHSGYGCCRSNFHFGWPKFVQNMWMATDDDGLALAAYGPNSVTAKAGPEGKTVTIEQDTGYPFLPGVTLSFTKAEHVAFALSVRIPAWCSAPRVAVNGNPMEHVMPGSFLKITRTWSSGDRVRLDFQMTPALSHGINGAVAVTRGPLVFAMPVAEQPWTSYAEFGDGGFHAYEIRPDGAWNYALLLETSDTIHAETSASDGVPRQPFKTSDAPVRLKVQAFKTERGGWGTFRQDFPARAVEPPASPLEAAAPAEAITLVPYGATQTRITLFPWAKR